MTLVWYTCFMQTPFDPHAFAKWFFDGLKETVAYRVRQTFSREKLLDYARSKIPSRTQVLHHVLRRTFERNGFQFEKIQQGDAVFHLIRKRFREVLPSSAGKNVEKKIRRLLVVPGFGDTPASWIPAFGFSALELHRSFDEIVILDFPGYLGFLSESEMVPSMAVLLGVVKTVCELHPPTVLMGHSLGGWLAGKVAQQVTKPIEHLILVAPSGLTPESERKSFGDFIVNSQNLTIDELIERVIHEPKKFHNLIREDIRKFYSRPEVKDFVESVKPEQFIDSHAPFMARKLTVIWGEKDRFVPVNWLRHWVENYGAHLDAYVMKNTAHLPQLERPKVFSEILMHAITGRENSARSGTNHHWIKVNSRVKEFDPHPRIPYWYPPPFLDAPYPKKAKKEADT